MRLPLVTLVLCTSLFAQNTPQSESTAHSASPADLEGRQWKVVLNGAATRSYHELGQKGEPSIKFENGRIEGSPGCGQFVGEYSRKNDRLALSVRWTDDNKIACDIEHQKNARLILTAFKNVRRVQVEPAYWRSDLLQLVDKKGAARIILFPMRPGQDFSELQNSFWRLTQLKDSTADFSGIVVNITERSITLVTPHVYSSFPYEYKLNGLNFSPASAYSSGTPQHQQIVTEFENALHMIASYQPSRESLTFFDKGREPIIVLSPVQQQGVENRRWRIAKYRNDNSGQDGGDALVDTKYLPEITFFNDHLEGSHGCGWWMGAYHLTGNELKVMVFPVLIGRCHPEARAESLLLVTAFSGNLRIEERDGRVSLRDENGKTRVLLEPY